VRVRKLRQLLGTYDQDAEVKIVTFPLGGKNSFNIQRVDVPLPVPQQPTIVIYPDYSTIQKND